MFVDIDQVGGARRGAGAASDAARPPAARGEARPAPKDGDAACGYALGEEERENEI